MSDRVMVMEGSIAVAEAIRGVRPDVISAYPISPQTHIVEGIAKLVADGKLDCEYIRADSEFSAASIIHGASAAGVRAYTATSSQGLLLMTEVLYNTAGTRLPVVITVANRTISPPISIQPDHQDSMTMRDTGFIQLYVESIQEAYDAHIQAFRIAEDRDVLLPVMVCMDGWILTHAYEQVKLLSHESVSSFVGDYQPVQCLDPRMPLSYGAYADEDKLMEFKYLMMEAHQNAKTKIEQAALEYKDRFGNFSGGLIDSYRTEDAEIILIAMGSVVSTIRAAVDEMREEGIRVGLLKVRCFRPFPKEAIIDACSGAGILAVLDKSISIDSGGILVNEVKAAFYNQETRPIIASYIAGLGGKEVNRKVIKDIVSSAQYIKQKGKADEDILYVGLNKQFVSGGDL